MAPKNPHQPDLKDKVVIVTGCNTGIGLPTVQEIAKLGATVILANRSEEKTTPVLNELKTLYSDKKVFFIQLDLSDLNSVKAFADAFLSKFDRLDILINNAGVSLPKRELSKQGFEMHMATNHYGHFTLTLLLQDILKKTPNSRIVVVGSAIQKIFSLNFDDLHAEKKFSQMKQYGVSKIANTLIANHLASLLKADESMCKVVSLHPGIIKTQMLPALFKPIAKTPEQGAQTTLFCSLIDWEKLENGGYYSDCKLSKATKECRDPNKAKKLWNITLADIEKVCPGMIKQGWILQKSEIKKGAKEQVEPIHSWGKLYSDESDCSTVI